MTYIVMAPTDESPGLLRALKEASGNTTSWDDVRAFGHIVMASIVMASILMAYIVMA